MTHNEKRLWLIENLLAETGEPDYKIPSEPEAQWRLLRALFNMRMPLQASKEFLKVQDEFLSEMTRAKGIIDVNNLEPCKLNNQIFLWQGDITRLNADAVVNAANSKLLGCFQPNHNCIDNILHTMAGVQMRLDCYNLMQEQKHDEPEGQAKITSAYNLPAKFVIHTVGPYVLGELTQEHKNLLASCYNSCLDLAAQNNLKSIAFCCISTGVFNFPNESAAQIAVNTVIKYLEHNKDLKIIFNVFKDLDLEIYNKILN
ncbi:MAG: protein-ADP-ribose hydrolase [Synergistaceae bacterium]|nr:protein-ADP-ribose hydrolase [Synergistaceae bacterium]